MGIIETLSAGFALVTRRFWLIAIPVLLDLLLWLGPRISIAPLASAGLDHYDQLLSTSNPELAASQESEAPRPPYPGREVALSRLGDWNVLSLLAWGLPWGLPSLMSSTPRSLARLGGLNETVGIESLTLLVGLVVVLMLASLLGVCLYLGPMGQLVRDERFDGGLFLRRIGLNWLRLVGLFLIIFSSLFLIGLPLGASLLFVNSLSPGLASLLSALVGAIGLWLMFYLFFVHGAIFVGDVNPISALWQSFNIVRRNFWSSLGLVFLIVVIQAGTPIAWGLIMGHPLGILAAILGNAYIATGLAAATLIFYRDRYALWQQSLA